MLDVVLNELVVVDKVLYVELVVLKVLDVVELDEVVEYVVAGGSVVVVVDKVE
ncbi:MAG: hypothetical protein ACXAEN_22985 [Candidatus Thorarchaeota archaeon]